MIFSTRELIRRAARNLLAHRDVGRSIDPMSEQWAEDVLRATPAEESIRQVDQAELRTNQPEVS